MKILICHNFYQQQGGEDVAVLALKALLEQKGHQVILFTADNRDIERYTCLQKLVFFPRTLFSLRTYRDVRQIAERERPDIAHVHNVFPLLSPSLYIALNQSAIPIVQTIHNYRFMCLNGLFLRDGRICEHCKSGKFFSGFRFKCYRGSHLLSGLYAVAIGYHRRWGTFKRIDRFIALSAFSAKQLVESGVTLPSKISILEHFLPAPLPEYWPNNSADPYVCYLGRLSQEKGIFTLLEALRRMRGLQLKILGTGPLSEQIKSYIQDHKLNNIELLGFVNGDEKYRILNGALCCVVPSECYEHFPLAVLESAAVGIPIVASRIGGLPKLVLDGETGLLFTPGSSGELRDRLELLMVKPETALLMGHKARRLSETRYSADLHYEALINIYKQVTRRQYGYGSGDLSRNPDNPDLIPNG